MIDGCPCRYETDDELPSPTCDRCEGTGLVGVRQKDGPGACAHRLCPATLCLVQAHAEERARRAARSPRS